MDEYEKEQEENKKKKKKKDEKWIEIENLSDEEWNLIDKIISILEIPLKTTKFLQRTNYTLSDFYGQWLLMENAITREKNASTDDMNLAEHLLKNLILYRGQLLANPMMVSVVFLDPRFSSTMKLCAKTLSISKLTKIFLRLNGEQLTEEEEEVNSPDDELELFLTAQERELSNELHDVVHINESPEQKIHRLLQEFTKLDREHAKINVLDYWENKKMEMPELYSLSQIIFTIAATQTHTERSFSTFAFIFSNYRTRINQTLLTDILIIRPNKDLFDEIVVEHLNELK